MIGSENWSLRGGGHYYVKFLLFHYIMGVYYLRMGVLFSYDNVFWFGVKIYLNGPYIYVCLRLNCAPVYFISYLMMFEHKDNTQFEIEGCLAKHVFVKMLWNKKIRNDMNHSIFRCCCFFEVRVVHGRSFARKKSRFAPGPWFPPKCLPVVRNASTHSNTNSNCDRDRLSRTPKYL